MTNAMTPRERFLCTLGVWSGAEMAGICYLGTVTVYF